MEVYQAKVVKELEEFYASLLYDLQIYPTMADHLAVLADRMYEGIRCKENVVYAEINNYHKNYLGQPVETLKALDLSLEDCRMTIANEYGFRDWESVGNNGNVPYNIAFETAINAILLGDIDRLKALLKEQPNLIHQKSQYGHAATLLHYTASNGVEFWRQKVPSNLVEITKYLLDCGADRHATMNVYNGEFDTLSLISTSAHPKQAGVLKEMEALLKSNKL